MDEDEENEESRTLEAQARKDLEDEGCPPCYPPDLDIPLQNPPEKYQAIIKYWKSFPGTGEVVLCAQRFDWQKFRTSQRRDRNRYRNKTFSNFVDGVRERRRRHEVGGHIHLLMGPEQQSRLETWMEFQNYHLTGLERLRKKREELENDLDNAQKEAQVSEHAAKVAGAVRQCLKHAERDLDWHKVLLQWIEQERQTMSAGIRHPSRNTLTIETLHPRPSQGLPLVTAGLDEQNLLRSSATSGS